MTTSSSPAGRLRYRFSLDEHDWLGDVEDPTEGMLEVVRSPRG